MLHKLLVAFFPTYSRFSLIGGSVVLWIYSAQYLSGLLLSVLYNFSFDIGVPGVLTFWWESLNGSFNARLHSELGNLVFFVLYIHIFLKVWSKAIQAEIDHTWISGIFIACLFYLTGITGAIMPCSILSEVTATIVGYSLNSITIVSFDFFETFLIPGLGLTDETISRVFFIHLIAPSAIFLIVADHINNLHSTDYTDEDEIEVTYILRREYILEFFWIETYIWFEYFVFFILLRIIVDFFWPEDMTVSYTLSNLEFWPLVENINYVIAIPHWYLRPLMSSLVTIPHHYLGFIYVICLFLSLFLSPWFDDANKSQFPFFSSITIVIKFASETVLFFRYFFSYLLVGIIYICTIVPTGRYFIPVGGNEEIVHLFWILILYFIVLYKLPNIFSNFSIFSSTN